MQERIKLQQWEWKLLFDGRASKDNDSIVKYVWDFGDGTTGAGATPTHVYMKEGLYQVTLTVFDPAGNSSEDTVKVDVRPIVKLVY